MGRVPKVPAVSAPQPPAEPEPPEPQSPIADPEPESDAEFDLPYVAAPHPRPRPSRRAPGALRAFLFLTETFIVGTLVGQVLGALLGLWLLGERLPLHDPEMAREMLLGLAQQPLGVFCIGAVSLLLDLIVTLAFTRGWDRRPLASVGFQADTRAGLEFAAGLVLGAALMGVVFALEAGLGWLRVVRAASLSPALVHALVWFGALLPAAAAEEVTLRGYPFQALREQWGGAAATLITALVFGALHLTNPDAGWRSLAGIFVSGILFGSAVLATGRLWLPIGLHVAWNLFEGPVLGFPVSGFQFPSDVKTVIAGPVLWTGGKFGPEAGLLGILASALGAFLLLAVRRRTLSG